MEPVNGEKVCVKFKMAKGMAPRGLFLSLEMIHYISYRLVKHMAMRC